MINAQPDQSTLEVRETRRINSGSQRDKEVDKELVVVEYILVECDYVGLTKSCPLVLWDKEEEGWINRINIACCVALMDLPTVC